MQRFLQQRNVIVFTLLALFLLETTIFQWLIPLNWRGHMHITPHFLLIIIVLTSIYVNRHFALALGLIIGFLQDVLYYGHMLGPHTFALGLTGYLAGLIFWRANVGFIYAVFIVMLGCFFYDMIIYAIYRLFNVVEQAFSWAFMYNILPSLLFNLFLALLIYFPFRYMLERLSSKRKEEES